MKSDSEEGEIARVSGSEAQSDDQEDQDHLEIKPPQHQYTERDSHRSKHHEYRGRTSGEKRPSDSKGDRRHQSKRHRYSREREREGLVHGDHDRRRDSKRKESSRQTQDRRERRSDRDDKYREKETSEKSSVRDAREKLVKLRTESKEKPSALDSGDEELRRRRERLLANYHEHEREKREREKERLKEKSTQERELPASYKFDPEDDGEKKKNTDDRTKKPERKSSSKKTGGSDNSADSSDSEESSGSEDEEEEDDSEDATADEDHDGASTGERKPRSDDERVKSSPVNAIDVDRNSDNGDDRIDKAEDDDEDPNRERSRERDIREVDEFLENRPTRDKDEDSQDAADPDSEEDLIDYLPAVQGCRRVEEFHCLNRIEEGTYGVVYRAKCKLTNEIVALKRLKMENEKEGFPITSLREIHTLLKAQHPNIVTVREIVVGSNMDKIYIVMDYVEHDLKSLMETMKAPFLTGEVKTLMIQLLRAVAHMHDNWILHRDLKTSNLLLSHKGILKVGDFGLGREYGSPLKNYTPIVVTLWYRAPELLLGSKEYSCPIDVWSVGCIFGELLTMAPLFPGKSEIDELNKIFKALGTPSEKIWPGYNELPMVKKFSFEHQPFNHLRKKISEDKLTDTGFKLLNKLLTYCPQKRITAEEALHHEWFEESPEPIDPEMFPTWPAKSEGGSRKAHSPKPPAGGQQYSMQNLTMQNELFPSRFGIGRNINTP
ncbi:cyclin-dependent kinase 11B [Galendromus occidentalis]|uniref:cyclin-dependent kinase n=1 Tax=Galendromus occidentalis TaxID=34638 RepID=A0AAJ6QMV1_9ACAR|nr:cyclin-dependent kinase 11B [Galendromus occidentalis]